MESSPSSFIHHLIDDIFEDTLTEKPSDLPWHIPKHFFRASQEYHRPESPPRKLSRDSVLLQPLHPDHFPDPSPEQPLRDTLLSTVIGLASFLAIKTLLIVSRSGGTVKRLRELTDHFQLIALAVSSSSSAAADEPNRYLRSLCCQLENVDLVHIKCDDDHEVEAFAEGNILHHPNYEATLERITGEGLTELLRRRQVSSGDCVLVCYRAHPRDSCVNAFKILSA